MSRSITSTCRTVPHTLPQWSILFSALLFLSNTRRQPALLCLRFTCFSASFPSTLLYQQPSIADDNLLVSPLILPLSCHSSSCLSVSCSTCCFLRLFLSAILARALLLLVLLLLLSAASCFSSSKTTNTAATTTDTFHSHIMGDPNDIFGRMFASFVNRKIRGHRSNRAPPPPVPQEPLRRTTSEYRASRPRPRGIAGLLSPTTSRTPTNRSSSSSQQRAGSSAAAAAASAAAHHLEYSGSNATGVPTHHLQHEYDAAGHIDHAAPRRHSGRYSEKTISDDDRPPRKRSRTHHIVRSQSAHSVGNRNSRRNAAENIAPRPAHVPRTRPAPATRSFPCPQCNAVFQQRGQLARHTRRVHEKLRPYECEHCGRLFGARSDRTRHVQVRHPEMCYTP